MDATLLRYRVAVKQWIGALAPHLEFVTNERDAELMERSVSFIRWVSDWIDVRTPPQRDAE